MQRIVFIERLLRQIYNGQPPDDATITHELVNKYLIDATGAAAKQHYQESIKIDNIAYVNNSFYTSFAGLAISKETSLGMSIYKTELPMIPVGLGRNEGVASIRVKGGVNVSYDAIPLSVSQVTYAYNLRPIPNRIMYWTEGSTCYFNSSVPLLGMTVVARMVSGGDDTDLDSNINVPSDWFPFMNEYILKQLLLEHTQPKDNTNDGSDAVI